MLDREAPFKRAGPRFFSEVVHMMSMTSLHMSRVGILSLAILLLTGRLEAQQMVVSALPAPSTAKEALYGSISPDGRSFVYEVIEGDERLLWRLDLGSLKAVRLTAAPGVRYDPVWASDSRRLAYWRGHPLSRESDGSEGLYVLDVYSRAEQRLLLSTDDYVSFAGDVAWLPDGRILYWKAIEGFSFGDHRGGHVLAAIRASGARAQLPPLSIDRSISDVISPSGTRAAHIDSCCGGVRQGIWMRDATGDRCIAGPITAESGRSVVWTRDEKRVYFIARESDSADSLAHAFAVDLQHSVAWRIGPTDRAAGSVSVSVAGDVAITQLPVRGRIGSLSIIPAIRAREAEPGAAHLLRCPPIEKSIRDFVRRAKLPKVHSIDPRFEAADHGLTAFAVTYGEANDIYPMRIGLQYGSRIGWIAGASAFRRNLTTESKSRAPAAFPLRSSDEYLFSDSLARRLQSVSDVDEYWRNFLLGSRATPFRVIIREVRRDPHRLALVALENPTVTSDTIPFEERLKLAALEDTLAMSTVWLPSVLTDPERLARVADLPMYRSPGQGLDLVHYRMQKQMPSLVKMAHVLSERAALHAYMAEAAAVDMGADSLRITLLHGLSPPQHRVIFALEAMRDGENDYAREALRQLGSTPERELLEAVRRVRKDDLSVSLPQFMLMSARQLPWTVLDAISRLDERFRNVRAHAALALAEHRATPDSVLRILAFGLRSHRDPLLAERLLERAAADTSRALLQTIASLDSARYQTIPMRALQKLRLFDLGSSVSTSGQWPTPRAAPSPAISDSNPYDTWMSADQCLHADDWSEQLRLAIGDGAVLIVGHSLCTRAASALDSAFEQPAYDSVYVFRIHDGWALAMPPKRADADVTVVHFDSAFIERSRRIVHVH